MNTHKSLANQLAHYPNLTRVNTMTRELKETDDPEAACKLLQNGWIAIFAYRKDGVSVTFVLARVDDVPPDD